MLALYCKNNHRSTYQNFPGKPQETWALFQAFRQHHQEYCTGIPGLAGGSVVGIRDSPRQESLCLCPFPEYEKGLWVSVGRIYLQTFLCSWSIAAGIVHTVLRGNWCLYWYIEVKRGVIRINSRRAWIRQEFKPHLGVWSSLNRGGPVTCLWMGW